MYSSEDLKKAVEAVNSGRLSLCEVSKASKEVARRLRQENRSIKSKKKHLIIKGNRLNWCPITGAMITLE